MLVKQAKSFMFMCVFIIKAVKLNDDDDAFSFNYNKCQNLLNKYLL